MCGGTQELTSLGWKIVEVSPRDGLQNESQVVPTALKLELIGRLGAAGCGTIEAGAFVSPKWVPQMGDTPEVLRALRPQPGTAYPVLVPNVKGLERLLDLRAELQPCAAAAAVGRAGASRAGATSEIAVFTAATDAFTRANTNCTVRESLGRCAAVSERAIAAGLTVRGYVSVVAVCPYEGRVNPRRVAEIARALLDMGCYEVSLGDTTGAGAPQDMQAVLAACAQLQVPFSRLAGHCHQTFGTAVANVLAMADAGVRTFDASVAGLGGCPYSPGATGNVDTESLVYALHAQGYSTGINLEALAHIGQWISSALGRPNGSPAGRAILARERANPKM